jgi:hypothetical protein
MLASRWESRRRRRRRRNLCHIDSNSAIEARSQGPYAKGESSPVQQRAMEEGRKQEQRNKGA